MLTAGGSAGRGEERGRIGDSSARFRDLAGGAFVMQRKEKIKGRAVHRC